MTLSAPPSTSTAPGYAQPLERDQSIAAPRSDQAIAGAAFGWVAALALGALFTIVLCAAAFAQHNAYSTGRQDLEIYTQVIWNTAHGRPFETTLLKTNQNHLAEHLAGAVLLLAPIYALVPDPRLLIGVQQLFLGLTGLPIYAWARARLGGTVAALALTAAFYVSPALASIALDDFHPVALTALPLGLAAYWLFTRRTAPGLAMSGLAIAFEEEAALVVAGLGLALLIARQWRVGLALLVAGALWLALAAFVIMPRFHTPSTLPSEAANRSVGHFQEVRSNPQVVLERVTGERGADALKRLLLPTAGIPLLAPQVLLADVPSFLALFLQDRDDTFRRHWAAAMLPILWMASASGLARLPRGPARAIGLSVVLGATLVSYRMDSPLPGGGLYDPARFERGERAAILDQLLARVPPDTRVAASANVVAHIANRSGVYVFPPGDHYAEAIERQARRPNFYILDLFDPGTQRIAALDRLSPLLARPAYAVWSPGHKAVLLMDRPPDPGIESGAIFDEKILLRGYQVRREGQALELELQWQKFREVRGRYDREIEVMDASGRRIQRQEDMPLGSIFDLNKWQINQVIVDTLRINVPQGESVDGWRARVVWVTSEKRGEVRVNDGSTAVEIPLGGR